MNRPRKDADKPAGNRGSRVRTAQTAVGIAVCAFSALLLVRADTPTLLTLALSLALVAIFGHYSLKLPKSSTCLSVSEPIIISVMLVGGPAAAALLAGFDGYLGSARHTPRRQLRLANGSVLAISAFVGGWTLELLAPAGFRAGHVPLDAVIVPTLAAALVSHLVNLSIIALVNAQRSGTSLWGEARVLFSWTGVSHMVSAAAALMIWVAYMRWGIVTLLLAIPTTAGIYTLIWSVLERSRVKQRHLDDLQQLHGKMMEAFALAIDSRDQQSRGHARRVQAYARAIAGRVQDRSEEFSPGQPLENNWIESLSAAALLHDVGKLGVPDQLLHNTERLSRGEEMRLREHAVLGAAIVGRIPFALPIAPAIREHHECWDGSGYPAQLRGQQICLEARIIALADMLDHHRTALSSEGASRADALVTLVARQAGVRLDPRLAELYCRHVEEIEEEVSTLLAEAVRSGELADTDEDTAVLEGLGHAQREAGMLYDLARKLGTTLDIADTCQLIVGQFLGLLPADSCAIYLADKQGELVVPRAAEGPLRDALSRRSFASGEGITGWVLEVAEPALNADPRVDLGWESESGAHAARSQAVVPIQDADGILGVLAFYSQKPDAFTSDHVRILESAMPQAARALRNASLYESTRNSSMTDELTKLPNSRFLYSQLDKEVARATRRGQPLVVVVMDLDGFKPINDTWGHQAGDQVLRSVARLLEETFRQGDIVCRYAGDEFVALLPETSPEEARTVVTRVQETIQQTKIPVNSGGKTVELGVGCSAGQSCFPIDGSTLEELIHRADKEMYRDKNKRHAEHEIESRR